MSTNSSDPSSNDSQGPSATGPESSVKDALDDLISRARRSPEGAGHILDRLAAGLGKAPSPAGQTAPAPESPAVDTATAAMDPAELAEANGRLKTEIRRRLDALKARQQSEFDEKQGESL